MSLCFYGCDKRGCTIKDDNQAPAPGLACKCHYDDGWKNEKHGDTAGKSTCTGEVVSCRDGALNRKCMEPDSSLDSCYQGGGNCGDY